VAYCLIEALREMVTRALFAYLLAVTAAEQFIKQPEGFWNF
jgi:hypothetical protein